MLILLLTLIFIFSIATVSAIDSGLSDESIQTDDNCVNYMEETNHQPIKYHTLNELNSENPSVSKDFDFFGLFDFFKPKEKYGFWVWSGDMYNVDFDKLEDDGVNIIFLNSYAFTEHGQRDVLEWIKQANDHGIEVHIWMQIFNTGDWISPLKNGTPDKQYFNYKIEEAEHYASLEGVDGIQLDYIRFEGNAYTQQNGTATINEFVKSFSERVKKVNPSLTLSATVMPECENGAYYYGQDIQTMSKYLDVIIPMMYKGNYEENSSWIKNTTEWYVNNTGDAKVWVGLQTYTSDFNVTNTPADELIKDQNLSFDGGADGVIYFKWGMNPEIDNKKLH